MANILITGASSGIGEALAYHYATNPNNQLFLSGRNFDRLKFVATQAQGLGAKVDYQVVDVIDKTSMQFWLEECHKKAPLNLVIANAGVSTDEDENPDSVFNTLSVNVLGVAHTIMPVIDFFKKEGYHDKQVAIVSSIAGYYPMSQCPAYSASKNGVKAFGLALRERYKKFNIKVNVICPGFVRSRITDKNTCKMPFFMEAEDAAKIIVTGLEKNKAIIAFPWQLRIIMAFMSSIPHCLSSIFMSKLPKKRNDC